MLRAYNDSDRTFREVSPLLACSLSFRRSAIKYMVDCPPTHHSTAENSTTVAKEPAPWRSALLSPHPNSIAGCPGIGHSTRSAADPQKHVPAPICVDDGHHLHLGSSALLKFLANLAWPATHILHDEPANEGLALTVRACEMSAHESAKTAKGNFMSRSQCVRA